VLGHEVGQVGWGIEDAVNAEQQAVSGIYLALYDFHATLAESVYTDERALITGGDAQSLRLGPQ
jgi:hypothetical protein